MITKKKPTVAKVFDCLFCDHRETVEVAMNYRDGTGTLRCRQCGESRQYPINSLSAPIDVYSEWVDETDALNREALENSVKPKVSLKRELDHDSEEEQGDDYDYDDEGDEEDRKPVLVKVKKEEVKD